MHMHISVSMHANSVEKEHARLNVLSSVVIASMQ